MERETSNQQQPTKVARNINCPGRLLMKLFGFAQILVTCLLLFGVTAQFGIPRKNKAGEAEVDTGGDVHVPENKMIQQLQEAYSRLDDQMAANVAAVIENARTDPETNLLIRRLKEGGGSAEMEALKKSTTPAEAVEQLVGTLSEMNALEILFKDPKRAFHEMDNDGMVPKEKWSFYEKNPEALADDVRKSLYFTFVSAAIAGGFL